MSALEITNFPQLPNRWVPTYYYKDDDYFVAVVVRDDLIAEYYWDGSSPTYDKTKVCVRIFNMRYKEEK